MTRATPDERPAAVARLRGAVAHDPARLMALAIGLVQAGYSTEATLTIRHGLDRHPSHWPFADYLADQLASATRWPEVVELLRPVVARDGAPAHLLHLLGVALLWCDRRDEAHPLLERVATMDEGCDLADALLLARGSVDPPTPDEVSVGALLVAGCREADGALAAGDPARAIACLHGAPLLGGAEVQAHARLAVAHLGVVTCDPIGRMQKALVLASLVGDHSRERLLREQLPLAARWPWPHIEAVVRTAERWLDEVYASAGDDRRVAVEETSPAG